jgi:hypothetical protein
MHNCSHRWLAAISKHRWHLALAVSTALAVLVGLAGIMLARLSPVPGQPARASIPDYCGLVSCGGGAVSVIHMQDPSQPAGRKPSPSRIPAASAHKTSSAVTPSGPLATTAPAPASGPSPATPGLPCGGQWGGGQWGGGQWGDGGRWSGRQWGSGSAGSSE